MALLKTVSLVTRLSPRVRDTAPGAASVKNCSGIRANGFLGSVISYSSTPSGSLNRRSSSSPSAKESAPTEKAISFYVHEKRAPPNATLLSIASPDGQLGLSNLKFGSLLLYDNIIRDAVSEDSKELGREAGLVGKANDASSFYMNHVFTLTTAPFKGSLSLQGRFDPATTSEMVITGGTGDFRFARGFATAKIVSAAPDGSSVVIKYDLTLKYD